MSSLKKIFLLASLLLSPGIASAAIRDSLERSAELILGLLPTYSSKYAQLWDAVIIFLIIFPTCYETGRAINMKSVGIGVGLALFISLEVYLVSNNISITAQEWFLWIAVAYIVIILTVFIRQQLITLRDNLGV